ncbi:MAG: FixH family protein [Aquificaceae bacterium]
MKKALLLIFFVSFLIILIFLYLKKSSGDHRQEVNVALLSLESEGIRLTLYSKDGTLKVGKNHLILEVSPEGKLQSLYFYMPPMPGMGEMREDAILKEVGKGRYEGTVNISMAG